MEANREAEREGASEGQALARAAEERLTIFVVAPADNRRLEVDVPALVTPAELAENLVRQGCFPALPGRQQYQFFLDGGHQLDDEQPLSAAGVATGATLRAMATTLGACPRMPVATLEDEARGEAVTARATGSPAKPHTPQWLGELEAMHRARAAHFFLLHLNVGDYVFDGENAPQRLPAYLARELSMRGYRHIGLLSLSGGLGWVDGAPGAPTGAAAEPGVVLRQLADWLEQQADAQTALIIENLEHLVPAGSKERDALKSAEILTLLAQDEQLRQSGCLLIALSQSPEAVASNLVNAVGGVSTITVPLPGSDDRLRFLEYLASSSPKVGVAPLEVGLSRATLAGLTQGVTLAGLDALNRRAQQAAEPITYRVVRHHKKEAIERQSNGILEDLEPRHGFKAVGGLEYVTRYLRAVVAHLRAGTSGRVPKAVLLAGPPGTGKTLVAEALATESSFNLVRIGDVRSMWVGESERNLSQVLRLVVQLAPVVVFVDEVDQMIGGRDAGSHGDSGVSARLFGRLLNFIGSNEHRGKVVWIAATNRPDLIDEAMLRRFDRVFPFFVPGAAERARIFAAMPLITGITYVEGLALDRVVDATEGLTGSAIEVIVRRASEITDGAPITEAALMEAAEDYKPNHDPREYRLQSLLALHAANLYSSLPAREELPEEIAEIVTAMRRECSAAPLLELLRAVRLRSIA